MFEKNLGMSLLLDCYGKTLTERKLAVMNLYYNEDFSLAEIADEVGISRQGVRELIKKTETELLTLEEKLGLAGKSEELLALAKRVEAGLEKAEVPEPLRSDILELTAVIKKQ